MVDTLRDKIVASFSTHWELNDAAHRAAHFEEVFVTGLEISNRLSLGVDERELLFAAYFHDLFAWSRMNHHELSWEFVQGTDHPLIAEYLSAEARHRVAWACRQHRASYRGEFVSQFSELVNSADRGRPGRVADMVQRAVDYRTSRFPDMPPDETLRESIRHVQEKFGHGGYARYPAMYEHCYSVELRAQRDEIARLVLPD